MRNFRGLTKDGKMVYGWYVYNSLQDKHYIFDNKAKGSCRFEVIPESVAQQVGRQDKNKDEIYEGDTLRTSGGQILKVEIPDLINGDGKFRSIVIEECELEEKSK